MPFCPVCHFEYRPGFTECADCGAVLVDQLPPDAHAHVTSASAADVVVAVVHGQLLAEMWSEFLSNHGIASRMNPITGVADNVYPTDTVYELRVAAQDAPRAREILPVSSSGDLE